MQPPGTLTMTSITLGCGRTPAQVVNTMTSVREAGVDEMTLGQYMRPTKRHMPVSQFVTPEACEECRKLGDELGFRNVSSGPMVRSSYKAEEYFIKSMIDGDRERQRHANPESEFHPSHVHAHQRGVGLRSELWAAAFVCVVCVTLYYDSTIHLYNDGICYEPDDFCGTFNCVGHYCSRILFCGSVVTGVLNSYSVYYFLAVYLEREVSDEANVSSRASD